MLNTVLAVYKHSIIAITDAHLFAQTQQQCHNAGKRSTYNNTILDGGVWWIAFTKTQLT